MRLIALTLLLAGCSMLSSPYRAREPVPVLAAYEQHVAESFATGGFPDDADAASRERRNEVLSNILWLIDAEYADYEQSLYVSGATLNTLTDLTVLGATAAAGALSAGGSVVAPTILAGIAGAVTGGRLAVQEQFFAQHGRLAIIATMRAERTRALAVLTERMRWSVARYPLSRAMLDVQAYAQAGSVASALQSITDTAVSGLGQAQVELKRASNESDVSTK